jgi:hypothetical protein
MPPMPRGCGMRALHLMCDAADGITIIFDAQGAQIFERLSDGHSPIGLETLEDVVLPQPNAYIS